MRKILHNLLLVFLLLAFVFLTACSSEPMEPAAEPDQAVECTDAPVEEVDSDSQETAEQSEADSDSQETAEQSEADTIPEEEEFSRLCEMNIVSNSETASVKMYIFDDAGHHVETRNLKGITERFEYDTNGQMVSDTTFDSDSGAAENKFVYTYNENGLKASEEFFQASCGEFSEECDDHIDYTYDNWGNVILEEEVVPESGNIYRKEYTFTDEGKKTDVLYKINDHLYHEKKYTYHEDGTHTMEYWGFELGSNYEKYGVDYCYGIAEYDAHGNLYRSRSEIYDENTMTQELTYSYTYNEDGTKASYTDDRTGVVTYYSYENGCNILEDNYKGEEHVSSIEREFDDYGKVIQQTRIVYDSNVRKVVETTKYAYIGSNGTKTGYYAEIEEYYDLHKQ